MLLVEESLIVIVAIAVVVASGLLLAGVLRLATRELFPRLRVAGRGTRPRSGRAGGPVPWHER